MTKVVRRRRRTLDELLGLEPEKRGRGRPVSPTRQALYKAQADLAETKNRRLREKHFDRATWDSWRNELVEIIDRRFPHLLAVVGDTPANEAALLAAFREALAPMPAWGDL